MMLTKSGVVMTADCAAGGCLILFCGVSVCTNRPAANTGATVALKTHCINVSVIIFYCLIHQSIHVLSLNSVLEILHFEFDEKIVSVRPFSLA